MSIETHPYSYPVGEITLATWFRHLDVPFEDGILSYTLETATETTTAYGLSVVKAVVLDTANESATANDLSFTCGMYLAISIYAAL